MKFSDLVRSLDYLAPDVTLNVNGKSSVKTYLGSLLWLLSTGCFIASMVVLLSDYFDTTVPRINLENSSNKEYPQVDLRKNHMIPVILVYLDEVTAIPAEEVPQYATFMMQQITYKASQNEAGVLETAVSYSNWNFLPCSALLESNKEELNFLNDTLGDLSKVIPKYGLCANYSKDNTSVTGKGTDTLYSGVYFAAYPCTLEDPSQCKPVEEVKRVGFTYVVGEVSLNLGNYMQPVSFSYTGDEYYYLDPGLYNYYTYKLMLNQVSNAKGFLSEQQLLSVYATVDQKTLQVVTRDASVVACTFDLIQDGSCKPYFGKWIISGGRTLKYDRDYKDFVELIGDVGGAREFIFSVAIILYFFYNQHATKQVLLSAILNLDNKRLASRRGSLDPSTRKVFDQAVEQATSLIEESLDVVTIAKKINLLDVISDSVLPDHDSEQINRMALAKALQRVDSLAPPAKLSEVNSIKSPFTRQQSTVSRSAKFQGSLGSSKFKPQRLSRVSNHSVAHKMSVGTSNLTDPPGFSELEKKDPDSLRHISQDTKQQTTNSPQMLTLLYGEQNTWQAKKILHPPPFAN